MTTEEEVRNLEKALNEMRLRQQAEKESQEREEAKNHVYPDKFPFHIDDNDEVIVGWFKVGPCDENGDYIWDDYAEAKRRWEAYGK